MTQAWFWPELAPPLNATATPTCHKYFNYQNRQSVMDILEQKVELQKLINALIELGEDKEELELWQIFFDALNEEEREKLMQNLIKEKKQLEDLKKKNS
jgi:hypothetical protein